MERLKLQRKTNSDHENENTFNSSLIEQTANSGSGQALDPEVRATLEPQFGHSFADVRVFSDAQADRMARDVDAAAFTVGQNVFFRDALYDPESVQGMHLLTHELTHTIQQRGAKHDGKALKISQAGESSEIEADTASNNVMAGQSVQVQGSNDAAIQREEGTFTMPEVTVEGDAVRGQAYNLGLEDGRGRVSANRYIFLGNPEYLVEYDRGYKEGLGAPYELSPVKDGKPSTIEPLSPEKAESDKKDTEEQEREQKAQEQRWEFLKELSQEWEHL